MSFIKFIILIICFEFLYWRILSTIITLPAFPFVLLGVWALKGKKTLVKKISLVTSFIFGFIFGTLIPVLFFSAGIFGITSYFIQIASYPWVYIILGGLFCFWIAAPNGETNIFGVLISIVSYICYMTIFKAMGHTIDNIGQTIINWILAILIPLFILVLIIAFFRWVVSKLKNWNMSVNQAKPERREKIEEILPEEQKEQQTQLEKIFMNNWRNRRKL